MALPRKLKNFNVFYNGDNFIGRCSTVTLPKLARKMEGYRGGGMDGEVDVDLGQEKLEMEHTYGGHERAIYKQYGIPKADGILMRFSGAYQRDDTGEVDAVEIVTRGRHAEIDPGEGKAGDDTELKVKSSLTYYKLIVNGQVDVEIDLLNFVYIVDGVDRLAEQRAAIGL